MTEPAESWQSTLHAALLAPNGTNAEPRILVVPDDDAWMLPRAVLAEQVWAPACQPIVSTVSVLLGVEAVVLRCADARDDKGGREVELTYLLAPLDDGWEAPPSARAVDRAELAALRLTDPAQRSVLELCLGELSAAPSHDRMPWMRPGWFAAAERWIHERLLDSGRSATDPVEQHTNWGISCVLRVPTDAGDCYFKAIPPGSGDAMPPGSSGIRPLFANEPALVEALSARFPNDVPTPLAIDRERRWMLLPDVGEPLAEHRDERLWEGAVRAFARLQIVSVEEVAELGRDGCLDRRLETLPDQIEPLLTDANVGDALGPEALGRLRALAPLLRSTHAELARIGLPPALVHGDLHVGNIAVRDGHVTFFDWTDACIAHPFVDAPLLLEQAHEMLDDPDAEARLREVYLEEWAAVAPIARLEEAFGLAGPIAALHHAISYRHIVAAVDPISAIDLGFGLRWSLRGLLARLEERAAIAG